MGRMDELARHLSLRARQLGLADLPPADAPAETLAELARDTLHELIARGLLPDPDPQPGCWSAPRSGRH